MQFVNSNGDKPTSWNPDITSVRFRVCYFEDTSQIGPVWDVSVPAPGQAEAGESNNPHDPNKLYTIMVQADGGLLATGVFAAGTGNWTSRYEFDGSQLMITPQL